MDRARLMNEGVSRYDKNNSLLENAHYFLAFPYYSAHSAVEETEAESNLLGE